jgi:hypothetical protein
MSKGEFGYGVLVCVCVWVVVCTYVWEKISYGLLLVLRDIYAYIHTYIHAYIHIQTNFTDSVWGMASFCVRRAQYKNASDDAVK